MGSEAADPASARSPVAALYWEAAAGGSVQCRLCPHNCRLGPGQSGICKVRRNSGGTLSLPFYGAVSAIAMDPIEKKPLHHFLPGTEILSVGFVGCNLRCPFCQNWEISQRIESATRRLSPEELVEAARHAGSRSIAYTYSEPLVHAEFLLDTMAAAHAAGLFNVLVTNGCVSEAAALDILALTDAANVDLKCWRPESYKTVLGGELAAVLDFIRAAAAACHIEVTTLVVPGLSDGPDDMDGIANFLASLSPDIALHLSAYHPAWQHRAPATDSSSLSELARVARRSLRYVYLGNLVGEGADTRCPACGTLVIRRRGYEVELAGLARPPADGGTRLLRARCADCGAELPVLFLS